MEQACQCSADAAGESVAEPGAVEADDPVVAPPEAVQPATARRMARGSVAFISSVAGSGGESGLSIYSASKAALIGFTLGLFFGLIAGYFRDTWIDKVATSIAIAGVSVPHYWLGMVLVIIFSVQLSWLPAVGAGPGGSGAWAWDWEHIRYLILPAVTTSVIPMGIVTRTVRALTGDILSQDFVEALRAKGLHETDVFRHVIKNAAPTAMAVMGLQLGYMLGGSILIETVFSWPGSGLLLNSAIFQRDLPLLQGTILVLAMFFVILNLLVDIAQAAIDPRIKRS